MNYNSIKEIVEDLENNPVESGGQIYHPIPFPEFKNLTTSSNIGEVNKKWDLIRIFLMDIMANDLSKLNVLDVGANAGFYTFNLAKEGATVTSFEPHPRYAPIGTFLAKKKGLNVNWNSTPFKFESVGKYHYDVALLLSVFQWMSLGGEKMEEAGKDLKKISSICDSMVFELGYNSGKSCIKTNKFNHYAELIGFLEDHTEYKQFKLLGTTKLWKGKRRYLVACSHNPVFSDVGLCKFVRSVRI